MQLHATSTSNPFTDTINVSKDYEAETISDLDKYNCSIIVGQDSTAVGYSRLIYVCGTLVKEETELQELHEVCCRGVGSDGKVGDICIYDNGYGGGGVAIPTPYIKFTCEIGEFIFTRKPSPANAYAVINNMDLYNWFQANIGNQIYFDLTLME